MREEDEIRHMILYQKERLLHEPATRVKSIIAPKFMKLSDDERRGMVKALRWAIDTGDEEWQ